MVAVLAGIFSIILAGLQWRKNRRGWADEGPSRFSRAVRRLMPLLPLGAGLWLLIATAQR